MGVPEARHHRTGARLWTNEASRLENDFVLVVSPEMRHRCRVVWRSGQEAGIIFLPKIHAVDCSSEAKIAAADAQGPRSIVINVPEPEGIFRPAFESTMQMI